MPERVMTLRALNRALLSRQLLLRRAKMSAHEAIEHLVGMQAEDPAWPYVGLWSRLHGFRTDDVGELLMQRRAVRANLMRATIHLVSARDAIALRPNVQAVLERDVYPNMTYGRHRLEGLDMDALLAAGHQLLDEQPRTPAQLRKPLAQRWPDRDPAALAYAVRQLMPTVQVPPRGVWGRSAPPALIPMDSWLGEPVPDDGAPDAMLLRYLGAFGPATVADARVWSGLTGLGEVFERLRPSLRTFRDERGRELFDLPDAPRPDPDVPAPPRFLPQLDNVILSHADRRRVVSDEHRKALPDRRPGPFLVGGFVRGFWRAARSKEKATLTVVPFDRLPKKDAAALKSAGIRLLRFLHADADSHDVRFESER